jgi:hypothetical protein
MGYCLSFNGLVPYKFIQHNYSETVEGSEDLVKPTLDVTYNHDQFLDLAFSNVQMKNNSESELSSGEWWKDGSPKRNHGLYRLHGLTAEEQLAAMRNAIAALPDTPPRYDKYGWLIYDAGVTRRCLMIIARISEYWIQHPELREGHPEHDGTWRRWG